MKLLVGPSSIRRRSTMVVLAACAAVAQAQTPTPTPPPRPSTQAMAQAPAPQAPASQAGAQVAGEVTQLSPVVITATRTETAAFDVPASIDRIDRQTIGDARPMINISESLGAVAGLVARDRQNYAQDVQLSVRGFGARSTFGIRGVRLYVDGIPATLPDGQGQISNVDLGSADRIEVLRGPFSALYGNSSGGVVQIFTEEGSGPPTLSSSVVVGSDGVRRGSIKASGASGGLGYVVSGSDFTTDGYRRHSAAERRIGNAKLTWKPDDSSKLTLVANSVALPKAEDPLGLTRAQFAADPRGVDPSALAFDTRKTIDQTQIGIIYERRLDAANSIRALVYDGHRNTQQFQSIPVATQMNPLHPGGVIALGRDYRGIDVRWSLRTRLGDAPLDVVSGLAWDTLREVRQGFQNFVGTTLGVQGPLRRNESNRVFNLDPYVQATLKPSPAWTIDAGVRRSNVHFGSVDHYIVGANPDDSGSVDYAATLPVVGVLFAASDSVHLYATAGRGFETPTLNELAYRPSGGTGLDLGLQAATSDSVEAGVKTRIAGFATASAALFETRTNHEIVTLSNIGGRATYQNAGGTRRRGLEFSADARLARDWNARLAYTLLDARYVDTFLTCTATPCSSPAVPVAAGNRLPGVARTSLFASLGWTPPLGWRAGVEGRVLSRVWVNDINSDAAAGYAVAAVDVGYRARFGPVDVNSFARVDNLLARRYAGSVIVDEGNSRYFEPAPGRTWTIGVAGSIRF